MKRIWIILSAICIAALLLGQSAQADELFWDPNGATAGTGGTGTWTTANTWRNGSDVGTLQTWADGNNAHLAGTAGIVSISGGTTVSPLTSFFEVTGYTLRPTNTSLTTLAGSISLSAAVNLNYLSSADTADRQLAIGSVSGGAGSGLTFAGGQTAAGSNARLFLNQASSSIGVPITISGTGTTFAGFVASATGTSITGTISNSSSFTTLLGATSGNDLTLSSTAVISGTAGVEIGVTNTSDNVGTVTLNAASTYSGGTTLDGGTLVLGDNSALGSGTLTLSNSSTSVLQAGGSARTLANNVVWGGNGTLSGSNGFTFNGTFTSSGAISRSMTVSNTGGLTINGNVFLAASDVAGGLTINGASAVTINGVITNNAAANTVASALTKSGSNTLTLTAANTYTGTTTVNAGALLVNNTTGSGTGTGAVTVNAGTLGGTGSVSGAVTIGNGVGSGDSFISPGASVGTFTTTSTLSIANDGVYTFELNSNTSTADKIVANGITLAGTSSISLTDLGSTSLALGTTFTIIDNTSGGAISGTFSNLTEAQIVTVGLNMYQASYVGGDGNDLTLTVAVPEPSTWVMIGVGAVLLAGAQRFRRNRS
jgi:autotransporter-associated beta strand protein